MHRTVRLLLVAVLATSLVFPASAGAVVYYHNVSAVSFGGSTGYVAGGYSPAGVGNGFVSRTTDGGVTWQAFSVPGAVLTGVKASSDGVRASLFTGRTDFDWMKQTADSGMSWTPVDPVPAYSAGINDTVYAAGGRRIVVGELSNGYALIASSVGDGDPLVDWAGPVPVPSGDDEPPPTYAWFAAADATPDGNTVWAAGNDWTNDTWAVLLRKSTNGGSTWTTPTATGALAGVVTDIVAPAADTAYLTQGNGYLTRTFNGGATFDRDFIGSGLYVNAIDAYDSNNVVVVGDSGKVYYSANAGAALATSTWAAKTTGTTNNLNGVVMLDADRWIVVGDNETILRTDNAGGSWTGSRALASPNVTITSHAAGFALGSTALNISGAAADVGVGVERVQVALQRGSNFWNGSAWVPTQTWHDATTSDGWRTWSAAHAIDTTTGGLTILARSRDGMGQYSPTSSVTSGGYTKAPTTLALAKTSITGVAYGAKTTVSGTLKSGAINLSKTVQLKKGSTVVASTTTRGDGSFSFNFLPAKVATTYTVAFAGDSAYEASSANVRITPKAKFATPAVTGSYIKKTKYFTTYAYLYPKHSSSASSGTIFYFYRYEKVSGKYKWVLRKRATAKVTNSSKYPTKTKNWVKVKIGAGKWLVKAKHADTGHYTTWSPVKYFKVH